MTTNPGQSTENLVLQTYTGLGDNIYQRGHVRDWLMSTGAKRVYSPYPAVYNVGMPITKYGPLSTERIQLFPSYDSWEGLTFTETFEKRGQFLPGDFFFPEAGKKERVVSLVRPPTEKHIHFKPGKLPSAFLWKTVLEGPFRDEHHTPMFFHRHNLDEKVLYEECVVPSYRGNVGSLGSLMSGVKALLTTECFALPLALAARVPEIWLVLGPDSTKPERMIDRRLMSADQRIFVWEEKDETVVSRRLA